MKKGSEIQEQEGNVLPLLHDRFATGEREKNLHYTIMYGVTNVYDHTN